MTWPPLSLYSFEHQFAEEFLRRLLQRAFDRESSAEERSAAALYIASFVSRAALLCASRVAWVSVRPLHRQPLVLLIDCVRGCEPVRPEV